MITPIATIAQMSPYVLADLGGSDMTSLAQNESAWPPSPNAIAAGQAMLERAALYPDPDWRDLIHEISTLHNIPEPMILCGAGSMELIGCLIRAYAGPGHQVLGSQFGYAFVATATRATGAEYVTAPERDFTVDVDAMLAAITSQTRVVFVCDPGNPTGTTMPTGDLMRLRDKMPSDVLLVVDQAYAEFTDPHFDPAPIFQLCNAGNTVVTRTFSKAYGLAGSRVGWGVFPKAIALEMRKILNPNNISGVSQEMARAAMADQPYMQGVVARTATLRDKFAMEARALGVNVPESRTNFVLLHFADAAQASNVHDALQAQGLMMRPMAGYGLADCLRATIADAEVMDRAMDVMRKTL